MDICTAYVSLGGDAGSVVVRDKYNPLSWPEIGLVQFLHGRESVYNVEKIGAIQRHATKEKQRLQSIYGEAPVEIIYPGHRPMMEMDMPDFVEVEDDIDDPADSGLDLAMTSEEEASFIAGKRRTTPKTKKGKKPVLVLGDGKEIDMSQPPEV